MEPLYVLLQANIFTLRYASTLFYLLDTSEPLLAFPFVAYFYKMEGFPNAQ